MACEATDEKDKMILIGEVETADIEDSPTIEKLLTATQNNRSLKITGNITALPKRTILL